MNSLKINKICCKLYTIYTYKQHTSTYIHYLTLNTKLLKCNRKQTRIHYSNAPSICFKFVQFNCRYLIMRAEHKEREETDGDSAPEEPFCVEMCVTVYADTIKVIDI